MAPQKIRSAINSQAYFTMKFFPAGSLLKFYRTKGRQNEASDSLVFVVVSAPSRVPLL